MSFQWHEILYLDLESAAQMQEIIRNVTLKSMSYYSDKYAYVVLWVQNCCTFHETGVMSFAAYLKVGGVCRYRREPDRTAKSVLPACFVLELSRHTDFDELEEQQERTLNCCPKFLDASLTRSKHSVSSLNTRCLDTSRLSFKYAKKTTNCTFFPDKDYFRK